MHQASIVSLRVGKLPHQALVLIECVFQPINYWCNLLHAELIHSLGDIVGCDTKRTHIISCTSHLGIYQAESFLETIYGRLEGVRCLRLARVLLPPLFPVVLELGHP